MTSPGAMAFGLAFLLSLAVTPLVRYLAGLVGATDVPDSRRVHKRPTARGGGVGVFLAAATALAVSGAIPARFGTGVMAGGALLLVVGMLDDIFSLRASIKFTAQGVAALLAVAGGLAVPFTDSALDPAFTVLWIVFVTNAFNLSDGLDGLVTGMGTLSLLALAAAAWRFGDLQSAVPSLALAGGLLGFLPYNFNPATIFLGDSGSLVIGYAIAVLPIVGAAGAPLPPLTVFLLAAVPATDTFLAIARRFLSRCLRAWGEGKFWNGITDGLGNTVQPDRRHIHHRLLDLGFSQRRAVASLYLAAASSSALAYFTARSHAWPLDLFALTLAMVSIALIQALGFDELQPGRSGLGLPVLRRLARRRWLLIPVDFTLVAAAHASAIALTGHPQVSGAVQASMLVAVMAVAQLGTFVAFRIYRTSWQAAGVSSFSLLFKSCAFGSTAGYAALRLLDLPTGASTMVVHLLLLMAGVTLVRSSYLLLAQTRRAATSERALICGTQTEARHALSRLRVNGTAYLEPVGFIEVHPRYQGRQFGRLRVLGTLDSLVNILHERQIRHLVVADPDLRGEALDWVRAVCRQEGVKVHRYIERLVSYDDIPVRGPVNIRPARPVTEHEADVWEPAARRVDVPTG